MSTEAQIPPVMPPDLREIPLEAEIARRAFHLWAGYGHPEGVDVDIWLEAERQLLGADPEISTSSGGAVPAEPLGDIFFPPVTPDKRPISPAIPA